MPNASHTTEAIRAQVIADPVNLISFSQEIAALNLGYLTIAVTILALLGGAFYLFNFKPIKDTLDKQQEDLESQKKEIKDEIDALSGKNTISIDKFKEEQVIRLKEHTEAITEATRLDTASQIADFKQEHGDKAEISAEEKDKKLKELILAEITSRIAISEKSLTQKLETKSSELNTSISAINNKIQKTKNKTDKLSVTVRELEVWKYAQEGKMGSIYGTIDLLETAIEENWDWRISTRLDELSNYLKGNSIDAATQTRIEKSLTSIEGEPKYRMLIDKVRSCYRNA